MIRASDLRRFERNTLLAFCNLHLEPSGILIRDCTYHRQGEKEWVGLPGKPQIHPDGTARKDPSTGKPLYSPVVEIPDRQARDRFQQAALAAVRKLMAEALP